MGGEEGKNNMFRDETRKIRKEVMEARRSDPFRNHPVEVGRRDYMKSIGSKECERADKVIIEREREEVLKKRRARKSVFIGLVGGELCGVNPIYPIVLL